MPKLTGSEMNYLTYFAQFRDSEDVRKYYDGVVGQLSPVAKELADAILGYTTLDGDDPNDRKVLTEAKNLIEWADENKEVGVARYRSRYRYAELKHRHSEELKQFYRSLDERVRKQIP